MTEIHIARFGNQEAKFLDSVIKAAKDKGTGVFIHAVDGKSSTEVHSLEFQPGIRLSVQKVGPVETLTVKDAELPEPLIEADKHADAYIVYRHASAPWEKTFRKVQKAAKKASQEGLPPGALEEMGKTWNP